MAKTKADIFRNLNSEKNGTTAEEVVSRLREMIQDGELSAGDRLPPERDLAKLLGVSRPTLRAGIRSLTTVGILQSKQGAGTLIHIQVTGTSKDPQFGRDRGKKDSEPAIQPRPVAEAQTGNKPTKKR